MRLRTNEVHRVLLFGGTTTRSIMARWHATRYGHATWYVMPCWTTRPRRTS